MADTGCNTDGGDRPNLKRDGGERNGDGGGPSLGEILECLTSSYRRQILYYVQEQELTEVDELATHIATQEAAVSPEEVSSDHHNQIKTQLVHIHLPKLADTHCIEYDRRSSTVRYTQPPALLDRALRLLSQLEDQEE